MPPPSSYELLEVLHTGTSTYVIRAMSPDNKKYIIKENSRAVTSQKKLQKYFREYTIGSSINSEYVAKYVDMKRFGYGFALILEDIGGSAIKQLIPTQGYLIDQFFPIALKIVQGLSDIHTAGVVHKDINPNNIVVNTVTQAVNIIDFDIASRLSKEDVAAVGTHQIQGTLLYMAPEQTGRMNRHIDYRSDFYSLGATFYEMLCGNPPFRPSIDPLELIHKHIAITPRSLWEIKSDIPRALSDLVLKLMAKNAEDRYQDCLGILADLLEIQLRLKNGESLDNYIVGGHDTPHHFQVSQKLYGRSEQIQILTRNFNDISAGTVPIMMMLVHGYSGVGKTTLVNEVHKPLVRDKGYYVYGKFNQFAGNVPYAVFVQALKQLMQQILSESEQKLVQWKKILQDAVGKNGQVIIDVIPEFELVIGPQPPVTKLNAVDSHNRFKLIFIKFMSTIATKEHPLVIFIDDLQWADSSTLALLTTLLTSSASSSVHHLLILGAYRENEVSSDHPFVRTVEEIKNREGLIQDLVLLPLSLSDVEILVHHTCTVNQAVENHLIAASSPQVVAEIQSHELALARALYKKTEGNPFFINQLLTMLHEDHHIYLQTKPVPHWVCDMEQVEAANYTNNVVDLMVTKLRRTPEIQTVLGIAAQIGSQFELQLLADLCEISPTETLSLLNVPIQENFIVAMDKALDIVVETNVNGNLILTSEQPIEYSTPVAQENKPKVDTSKTSDDGETGASRFRFGHDRIQQASATLVPKEDMPKIHVRIAEQLLSRFQECPKKFDSTLLFLVNHLNQGFKEEDLERPVPPPTECYLPLTSGAIVKLNLKAAIKSKNTNAYSQALVCVDVGLGILNKWDSSWEDCYEMAFALTSLKAEISYLTGDYTGAESLYPNLLEHARSIKDKCSVYLIMYYQYELQNRYAEVIQVTRKGLQLYDVLLPPTEQGMKEAYADDVNTIRKIVPTSADVATLKNLPFCTDESSLSIMKLMQAMWLSAYVLGFQSLAVMLSSHLVVMSIEKGLCEESVMGLCSLGFNLGTYIRDFSFGYEFGRLAVDISDVHYPQTMMRAHVYVLFSFCHSWREPINTAQNFLITAFDLCTQTGDINWAWYALPYIIEYPFFQGAVLSEAIQQYNKYLPFMTKSSNSNPIWYNYTQISVQVVRDLIGISYDVLDGVPFESSIVNEHLWLRVTYYYAKTMTSFYMKNKEHWLEYGDQAITLIPPTLPCLYKEVETRTIVPLIYLDWISRSPIAHELYGTNQGVQATSKFERDNSDVDSEAHLSREEQIEKLHTRLRAIHDCVDHLQLLSTSCQCNHLHKLLLIQAECARVSLILGSTAIFSQDKDNGARPQQNFVEAMELYENAIQSAKTYGFAQYEAVGLELYALFWLTSTSRSKDQVASGYLAEAIFVCERWGALAKAQRIRNMYSAVLAAGGRYEMSTTKLSKMKNMPTSHTMFSADLETVVQASHAISHEVDISQVVKKMVKVIVETSGAQRATLFTVDEDSGKLLISAEYAGEAGVNPGGTHRVARKGKQHDTETEGHGVQDEGEEREVIEGMDIVVYENGKPLEDWNEGPHSVVNFTRRALQPSLLRSALNDYQFGGDPYIVKNRVKSVLCMPIIVKNNLKGVLYLENNLYEGLFNKHRMDLLLILTSQMAITIENTRFFNAQMQEQIAKLRLEQLTHDEERQRLRADAAEKYRSQLENFMDMICHEIRNPLNGIFGNSDLIMHYLDCIDTMLTNYKKSLDEKLGLGIDVKKEEEFYGYLEQIKVSAGAVQVCAEHQKCITDDVLQLSKLRANKLVLSNNFFNPQELTENVLRMFAAQALNKGIDLVQDLPEGEQFANTQVWADGMRIKQIITNIVSNAVKFTHKGYVKVSVSIEEDLQKEKERVLHYANDELLGNEDWISMEDSEKDKTDTAVVQEGNNNDNDNNKESNNNNNATSQEMKSCYLKFKVEDTGIGLTPEEQARIFTRFSQANNRTSKEYGGSGLGLAICKILARQMEGYVTVESTKDVGSVFYLAVFCKYSCIRPPIQPPPPKPASLSPQLKPGETTDILIVEDNLMNQMLLSRVLKIKGYTVHVANNGLEGLEKYQEQANIFDYILMDMQMPVMDGLEATTRIRTFEKQNNLKPATIIGLSGNARAEYKEHALEAGMNHCILFLILFIIIYYYLLFLYYLFYIIYFILFILYYLFYIIYFILFILYYLFYFD